MKILLTGSSGQLGRAIKKVCPNSIKLLTPSKKDLDLAKEDSCRNIIKNLNPDLVLNCGAYTSVDQAEVNNELAFAINANAPKFMAEELLKSGGRILQISTDFVFNGEQNYPYQSNQKQSAINIYGSSKSLGERYIEAILKKQKQLIILRTSWLMGGMGNNFASSILSLHSKKDNLQVITDQIGCPTNPYTLAEICFRSISKWDDIHSPNYFEKPILHWCDDGLASWYDVAVAVGEIGIELGLLKKNAKVLPIMSKDYFSKAKRPKYSLLNCVPTRKILGQEAKHWRLSLKNAFKKTFNITKA